MYDRVELARRLLGTATQLFIDDKDPISVHCLASSAAEHASYLAKTADAKTFNDHILATHPEKTIKEIRNVRNRNWNAIKHSNELNGTPKNIQSELDGFNDETNDHVLLVVWHDYFQAGHPLPIAAQVFQVWYLELHPEKLNPEHAKSVGRTKVFGNIGDTTRAEAKRRLRDVISHYSNEKEVVNHPMTDRRPLVLE